MTGHGDLSAPHRRAVPEWGLDRLLVFARHRYEDAMRSQDEDLAAWAASFVSIIDAMEAHLEAAPPSAYEVRRFLRRTAGGGCAGSSVRPR